MPEHECTTTANQRLFRVVNERIYALRNELRCVGDSVVLVCECGDLGCIARFAVPIELYEAVRFDPKRFFVARARHAEVDGAVVEAGLRWRLLATAAEPVVPRTRLVLADDDRAFRHFVRVQLRTRRDVEVVGEAADGEQAVELVLALRPDVVLLDVNMPRLNGFQAAAAIRAVLPRTLILLHSGAMVPASIEQGREMGLPILDKLRLAETIGSIVGPSR